MPANEIRRLRFSKADIERVVECNECPHWKKCNAKVEEPEDYPNGECKTKDILGDAKI